MKKVKAKFKEVRRKLPIRVVRYGGIFVSFRQPKSTSYYQCECSRTAIRNFLTIECARLAVSDDWTIIHNVRHSIGWAFGDDVVPAESIPDPTQLYDKLLFMESICHLCNGVTPDAIYCHRMYGSQFKQKWGWYINQEAQKQAFHLGRFLVPDLVSERVKETIPAIRDLRDEWNSLQANVSINREARSRANTIEKLLSKLNRQVDNEYENTVRLKLGYKPIGSRFVSETLMYKLVCELFNPEDVHRHAHPSWLKGLELDVYIPNNNLAFEYQGIQHYQPLDVWGGELAFRELILRDERKRRLCIEQGVRLIEVRFDEELTVALIQDKLANTQL